MSASVLEPPTLARSRRLIRVARLPLGLSAIVVIALGLRLFGIDAKSLWYDEGTTLYFAGHPLPELIRLTIARDTHTPLYYVLLHGWMQLFGDSVLMLRALSALASVLCLPVFFLLARTLAGRTTALLATALLALAPFHIWYAQEARMYALLALAGLTSTLALVRLLQRPGWGRWLAYVAATGVMLWLQYVAVFTLLAQALVVLALTWRGQPAASDRRWLWSAPLAAGASFLPWLPAFLHQNQLYQRFWIPASTLERLERVVLDFSSMHAPYWRLPGDRPLVVVGFFLALAVVGGVALRRYGRLAWLLPVMLAGLPLALSFTIGFLRPLFLARTLILVTPFYLLLIAAGLVALAEIGWRWLRASPHAGQDGGAWATLARGWPLALAGLGLLWVVGWNMLSLQNLYRNVPKEPWNEAARLVAQHAEDGDLLLFHSAPSQWPFAYYFERLSRPLPMHGIPHDADRSTGALEEIVTPADVTRLEPLLAANRPVWLILSHDEFNDPERIVRQAFDQRWRLAYHETLYNIELRRYVPVR